MLTTTPTMATTFLTLSAELRNGIYEYIAPPSIPSDGHTRFRQALQQQPALLHTCHQLRDELRPMYFSTLRLAVCVSTPEIQYFQRFIESADERVISALPSLSLTLPCSGRPELGHWHRWQQTHSVLYDIEVSELGRFEKTERHGFWSGKKGCPSVFGSTMHRVDGLGYSTCSNWGVLPIRVEDWEGGRFRKEELLALVDGLRAHELVAPRLCGGSSGEQHEP